MNWVDAVLIGVIVVSAAVAYFRGLVREVLSLGAWIGAAAAAFFARPQILPHVQTWLEPPMVADIVGTGTVFLVVLIILKIITNMIADRVQDSMLGGVDRVLAGMFAPDSTAWPEPVKQARSIGIVAETAKRVVEMVPEAYRPRLVDAPGPEGLTVDDLLRPPARSRN